LHNAGEETVEDLSLHILDIVENSLRSKAKLIEISIIEDTDLKVLTLQIKDNGNGMDPRFLARADDPFFTTKPGKKIGLGLALLSQAAKEAEGDFLITSKPNGGTTITATFSMDHPDRKPLGDMRATLETLVAANPGIDFVYEYKKDMEIAHFDTREIRQL